jgi:glycosyltransferase involved in cell wall biosynthesis
MSDSPLVSVCVPAYNAERTLVPTLDSILAQDFDDFELVVVDNHSTDGTADILSRYRDPRVRVCTNDATLPMAENWNRSVELARGELFKLVCSDDMITPQCLSEQVAVMRDPAVAVVCSLFDIVDDDGAVLSKGHGAAELLGRHSAAEAVRVLVRSLPDDIGPSAAFMFRTEDFRRTSGFRPDFHYTFDIDLWIRLCVNGAWHGLAESLAVNRASKFNESSSTSSLSKFRDVVRFNHAIAGELSGQVRFRDVAAGDLRVARAAWHRVMVRLRGAA